MNLQQIPGYGCCSLHLESIRRVDGEIGCDRHITHNQNVIVGISIIVLEGCST